ncbi:Diphthamide biosynthesis protein 2, partial [Trichostrongylus colubriformis]
IVHYGDACLSALTENVPVKFVFGSLPVDITAFGNVRNYLTKDASVPVLLLTDAYCSEKIDELETVVRQVIPEGQPFFRADIVDPSHANDPTTYDGKVCSLGRLLPQKFCDALAAQVCFVGDPSSPLIPLWLMTYPQCTSLVSFNPQTSTIEEHTFCYPWLNEMNFWQCKWSCDW